MSADEKTTKSTAAVATKRTLDKVGSSDQSAAVADVVLPKRSSRSLAKISQQAAEATQSPNSKHLPSSVSASSGPTTTITTASTTDKDTAKLIAAEAYSKSVVVVIEQMEVDSELDVEQPPPMSADERSTNEVSKSSTPTIATKSIASTSDESIERTPGQMDDSASKIDSPEQSTDKPNDKNDADIEAAVVQVENDNVEDNTEPYAIQVEDDAVDSKTDGSVFTAESSGNAVPTTTPTEAAVDAQPPTSSSPSPVPSGCSIDIGEVHLTRRGDGTLHPAQIIQVRVNEFQTCEFYVHYVGLNRRLDQWVTRDRILSPSPIAADGSGSGAEASGSLTPEMTGMATTSKKRCKWIGLIGCDD